MFDTPPPRVAAVFQASTLAVVQLQRSKENPRGQEVENPKVHTTKFPWDKLPVECSHPWNRTEAQTSDPTRNRQQPDPCQPRRPLLANALPTAALLPSHSGLAPPSRPRALLPVPASACVLACMRSAVLGCRDCAWKPHLAKELFASLLRGGFAPPCSAPS